MLASVPQGSPASNIRAALSTICAAVSTSIQERAIGNWTP